MLVRANTLFQHPKRGLYTWTLPAGQYQNQTDLCSLQSKMEMLYIFSKNKTWSSDHELSIAKFRLKLKKVGKTTRPFRYDLNQIPYDYTVEVANRVKGLGLVDGVPEELWMEVHASVQEAGTKTIPEKEKCKMAKWYSEEAFQTAEERRGAKGKGERERYTQLNEQFQRIAKQDLKKPS